MKTSFVFALFALGFASAHAEVAFQGYMTSSGKSLFVLSVEKDRTSGWLEIGQRFEGVSLIAFDSKTELLTIEQDGRRQAIHLVGGKTQVASGTQGSAATKPIVISIGKDESISVGDDAAMLEALKKKFATIAAMKPQPTVGIETPGDVPFERFRLVIDLLKQAGVTRFDLISH